MKRRTALEIFQIIYRLQSTTLNATEEWEFYKFRKELQAIGVEWAKDNSAFLEKYNIEIEGEKLTNKKNNPDELSDYMKVVNTALEEECKINSKPFLTWTVFSEWCKENKLSFTVMDKLMEYISMPPSNDKQVPPTPIKEGPIKKVK